MARIGTTQAGDAVILFGGDGTHLGQSVFMRNCLGQADGSPSPVDLIVEKRNGDFVGSAIGNGQFSACHDVSDGGLALCLAELCLASGYGMTVELDPAAGPMYAQLFGEDQARYVATVSADLANFVCMNAEAAGVPFRRIGTVGGDGLTMTDVLSISVNELRTSHESWFPDYMGETARSDAA